MDAPKPSVETPNRRLMRCPRPLLEGLECAECAELLRAPVMLVRNLGNLCADCYAQNLHRNLNGVPNSVLDALLGHLAVPCVWRSCGQFVAHAEFRAHRTRCAFRRTKCILPNSGCAWEGRLKQLLEHLQQDHHGGLEVVSSAEDRFDLTVRLEGPGDTWLLKGPHCAHLLRFAHETGGDHVTYFLYGAQGGGDGEGGQEGAGEASVAHVGRQAEFRKVFRVLPLWEIGEKTKAVDVNIAGLSEDGVLRVEVKIEPREEAKAAARLAELAQCPACRAPMRPPIFTCPSGHSVCGLCTGKLSVCPTCRRPISRVRNHTLEAAVAGAPYPCAYAPSGCKRTLPVAQLEPHEATCAFKLHSCHLSACPFKGNYISLRTHFAEAHPQEVEDSDFLKTALPFGTTFDCQRYLTAYGCVFSLRYHSSRTRTRGLFNSATYAYTWHVSVLGRARPNTQFLYEIGILDPKKPHRTLAICDLCVGEDEPKRHSVILSDKQLIKYKGLGCDDVTFYCKVSEFNRGNGAGAGAEQ